MKAAAAVVGREAEGLWLGEVERGPDGEIWYVWARLRVPGLDAAVRVSAHHATGFDELAAYFGGLASNWRGWPGERAYESLEDALRLTATHDGHVQLAVQLREFRPDGWSVAAVIQLDAGEELATAAREVAALLAPADRQRPRP